MARGSMSKCSKCGSTNIKAEQGRIEGAAMGASRLFFDVYICQDCGYTELYFQEKSYFYLGH
jgi:predicted nucleic-acid-binding Zn-ribbon protein